MENTPENNVNASPAPQLDAELQREIDAALGDKNMDQLMDEAAAAQAPTEGAAPAGTESGGGEAAAFTAELRRGRIAAIRGDDVFIEVAGLGKNQGVVPLLQFDRPPRIGSIMEFVVQRYDEAEGLLILSREGAVSRATWEQLQRGAIVEARVVATNKGGLELEMVGGIRAFMPASQIDLHHVGELEPLVGQKFQAMVQEIDRKSKKVVLSRRQHLEHERMAKQQRIWEELQVGQIREGRVSSVVEYGAFVDIGGVDGLVHVSDMSYKRVDKPADVVSVGQTVQVKVLKLDPEKKRISLGLKQVEPDPWESVAGRVHAGDQVTGKVVRLADFGAFVEIEAGIEGLLPVSEISWRRINKPADVLKEGDTVRLKVLNVDAAKHRISLSLKQAAGDPWVGASVKYAKNSLVEATVHSITDFGAFAELEAGIEGLVHISELADRRVNSVADVVKVGDKLQFRILDVDEEGRRIRLSLKQAKAAPMVEARPEPAAAAAPLPPARKKPAKPLKSGLGSSGALGMGLGDLKL